MAASDIGNSQIWQIPKVEGQAGVSLRAKVARYPRPLVSRLAFEEAQVPLGRPIWCRIVIEREGFPFAHCAHLGVPVPGEGLLDAIAIPYVREQDSAAFPDDSLDVVTPSLRGGASNLGAGELCEGLEPPCRACFDEQRRNTPVLGECRSFPLAQRVLVSPEPALAKKVEANTGFPVDEEGDSGHRLL